MKKIVVIVLALTSCTTTRIPSRFCVVVEDVHYHKKTSTIHPKGSDYWYHYPNNNIHKGDTVEVSLLDRVQPGGRTGW